MVSFHVIHNDGLVFVRIENGHATITVQNINDIGVLVRAINRAVGAGAKSATIFTGEFVNEDLGRKFVAKAEKGRSWRGGKVTRLPDGMMGPCCRIEFEQLLPVTE